MRLVIPYKHREHSEELRFAIRSMVKHFRPLSGVLLIGDRPEWYTGAHIPVADVLRTDPPPKIDKERSMQVKVLAVPDKRFLYSNDDFFANADFGEDLPNYYDLKCWQMAQKAASSTYRTLYENCQDEWNNYDVHVPMIMDRAWFHVTYQEMTAAGLQTPIKTTYAHVLPNSEQIADVKIRGAHTLEELEWGIKDRPFFSTHDSALNDDLLEFLSKLYPNKSKYESNSK